MDKVEHIGIAVRDISEAGERFTKLLNTTAYKTETVESEGVITMFFQVGETKIELLQATHEDSPIAKFIEKKGEGIHHIAFGVDSCSQEIQRLMAENFTMIHEQAKQGADNKMIAFLHPKSCHGVLTEICSEKENEGS